MNRRERVDEFDGKRYDESSSPHNEKNGARNSRSVPAITEIRIERVELVSMTATEYADAVQALAVLIARYERDQGG